MYNKKIFPIFKKKECINMTIDMIIRLERKKPYISMYGGLGCHKTDEMHKKGPREENSRSHNIFIISDSDIFNSYATWYHCNRYNARFRYNLA